MFSEEETYFESSPKENMFSNIENVLWGIRQGPWV